VEISVKSFEELTKAELYALLRLRVVSLCGAELPLSGARRRDDRAYHVIGREGEEMVAYLRILDRAQSMRRLPSAG
jgi:predicted GNAT family N-acyltransferase